MLKLFRRVVPLSAALAAVLLVMIVGPARAGFDEGLAAYERGDYETALKEVRRLAEQGNPLAQTLFGIMYDEGEGVPQDHVDAAKWFGEAAEQGVNYAQFRLGNMYEFGEGVTQDYVEAVRWYRLAAEQGSSEAQNNLGRLYNSGFGVTQDFIQAHMWYNLAAAQGEETARENRDIVAKKMTPAEISKAQAMAREWMEKHHVPYPALPDLPGRLDVLQTERLGL